MQSRSPTTRCPISNGAGRPLVASDASRTGQWVTDVPALSMAGSRANFRVDGSTVEAPGEDGILTGVRVRSFRGGPFAHEPLPAGPRPQRHVRAVGHRLLPPSGPLGVGHQS